MKQLIITIAALLLLPLAVMAQYEEDTENGVVSLNGKEGFTIATKKGDFVFKPYMLVQTSANINYYDDEGLDPAYNQDNIHNSGFSIPYAILGFTGKAFDRVTFNLSINAAGNGGNILQQAWFDVEIKKSFAIRVGKFKTPFSHAYLTTLGETLMPTLPTSLTSSVILPYSLNAVTPNIGMGFDLGVEVHGLVKDKFGYEVGIFNGTGSSVNVASKTFSDDWHIPSLLYAAVCIRTSTERPEAIDKACFFIAGIDSASLLQAVECAVDMNRNGDHGIPVPNYVDENVSTKVVKIIQSYTGIINKMVWRKF